MTDWFTVLELPTFYRDMLKPHLEATPVMTCLDQIITGDNPDDLRCDTHGHPLFFIDEIDAHTFLTIPRPEVHQASEDWSFERMRTTHAASYVSFWLHPQWSTQTHLEQITEKAHQRRGGHGQPNQKPIASQRLKPAEYLHTIRDLCCEDRPWLAALGERLEQHIRAILGPDVPVRLLTQYPNGAIKSTFHVQAWSGYEDGHHEHGRKHELNDLLDALDPSTPRPWNERAFCYQLHRSSGAARAILSCPHQTITPDVLIAGAQSPDDTHRAMELWRRVGKDALLAGHGTWDTP